MLVATANFTTEAARDFKNVFPHKTSPRFDALYPHHTVQEAVQTIVATDPTDKTPRR